MKLMHVNASYGYDEVSGTTFMEDKENNQRNRDIFIQLRCCGRSRDTCTIISHHQKYIQR